MNYQRIRQDAQAGEMTGADLAVWENHLEGLKQMILNDFKPDQVDKASQALTALAGRMAETRDLIRNQADKMVEAWGGEAAESAMSKMQSLHSDADEMESRSRDSGNALYMHAGTQRNWQNAAREWDTSGWDDWVPGWGQGKRAALNDQADQYAAQLQDHTIQANNQFPASLRSPDTDVSRSPFDPTEIDEPGGGKKPPMPGGGGGGGSFGGGSGAGGGGLPGGTGGLPGGGFDGGGGLPGDGSGDLSGGGFGSGGRGGTDLAGYHPPGGGGGNTGLPGGGGGGLGGGLGPGGSGAGGGLGAAGAGAGGLGAGGGIAGGIPGGGMAGRGGPAGAGGMPMGAGGGRGGGGDEEERERTTWLAEDEDVWGGDGDAAPPVIG